MNIATVNYSFSSYSLSVKVMVNTRLQKFTAVDNQTYSGYAIMSGSGSYTENDIQHSFIIAPQSLNQYNVLWAGNGGCGGNSSGIDTNGLNIEGDNGALCWNGAAEGTNNFSFQEGDISGSVTLSSVAGWPMHK